MSERSGRGFFCRLPFTEVSIHLDGAVYPACCPDWVAFPLGNLLTQEWDDVWNGDTARELRSSMYEGSLRYCDKEWCPHISEVRSGLQSSVVVPIEGIDPAMKRYPRPLRKTIGRRETRLETGPLHALLNYDASCNLRCPSCRTELKQAAGEALEQVLRIHGVVVGRILPHVRSISLTGVGDPFGGRVFREFLQGFDPRRFRGIESVHLNTNGQLFTREMFERMPGLRHVRLSTDISIDATTPGVYEKLRRPGTWGRLMENLAFIRTIENLECLGISMVVQYDNFRQMLDFIALGESLRYRDRYTFVEFKRLRNWGHLSKEEFERMSMASMSEADKGLFLDLLRTVEEKRMHNAKNRLYPVIRHNLQEFLEGRLL